MNDARAGRLAGAALALAWASLCACGAQHEAPADAAALSAPPAPPASSAEASNAAPPGTSSAVAAGPLPPAPATTSALRPPAKPGGSRSEIEGCLARGSGDDGDAGRFPVTRDAGRAVNVSTSGTGVVVTHDLAHACCLRGEVAVMVEGISVRITETLSGQPCRCRCSSSLRTAVGLAPGAYTLELRVVEPDGAVRDVHGQDVEVKRLRAQ